MFVVVGWNGGCSFILVRNRGVIIFNQGSPKVKHLPVRVGSRRQLS